MYDPAAEIVVPLTATFQVLPAEHAGEGTFTFRVAFSEPINTKFKPFRDYGFEVRAGTVTKAKRVDGRQRGGGGGCCSASVLDPSQFNKTICCHADRRPTCAPNNNRFHNQHLPPPRSSKKRGGFKGHRCLEWALNAD